MTKRTPRCVLIWCYFWWRSEEIRLRTSTSFLFLLQKEVYIIYHCIPTPKFPKWVAGTYTMWWNFSEREYVVRIFRMFAESAASIPQFLDGACFRCKPRTFEFRLFEFLAASNQTMVQWKISFQILPFCIFLQKGFKIFTNPLYNDVIISHLILFNEASFKMFLQ